MAVLCPMCAGRVAMDDINVARDLALCRACERTFSFADAVSTTNAPGVPPEPPSGSWFEPTFDGFQVGTTTRTCAALFLVPIALVWSGGSLCLFYGLQVLVGHFSLPQSLVGIPFLLVSVPLVAASLMSVCGRFLVTVRGDDGHVFVGVGPIGWRRRFDWGSVREVVEATSSYSRNAQPMHVIRLNGPQPISFGSGMTDWRRLFILAILRRELLSRGKARLLNDEL